jgi:K+-sensing histidine kinase KdpD
MLGRTMKYLRTYAIMIGSVAAAALITWLLRPHMQVAVSIVFLGAVMVSAWYGGVVPGLTAAALSVASFEYLFHRTPPTIENVTEWAVRTIMFVAASLLVSYFEASLRNALKQVETANQELRNTLDHVRKLESLLPICAGCKRIRDNEGEWVAIERYLHDAAGTNFTHGLCPACYRKYAGEGMKIAAAS